MRDSLQRHSCSAGISVNRNARAASNFGTRSNSRAKLNKEMVGPSGKQ
jgi:hypothetical protein